MILIGTLIYFGALLIPTGYLLATRWQGPAKRLMLIGAALQIFYTLAVAAFVYMAWRSGHADYYYGWNFLLPVNFVGLTYFVAVHVVSARKPKK